MLHRPPEFTRAVFTNRRGLPGGPPLLVHDRSIQKPEDPRQVLGLVELIAAVLHAVDHVEVDVEAQFLVGRVQLVSLVDRHLRILVAVQQQQWRIVAID